MRKAIFVALDGLDQIASCHPIQIGQVCVKHDPLAAYLKDALGNGVQGARSYGLMIAKEKIMNDYISKNITALKKRGNSQRQK